MVEQTVEDAMGNISDLLSRMAVVKPDLASLSRAANAIAALIDGLGFNSLEIGLLEKLVKGGLSPIHKLFSDPVLGRNLVDAVEMAAAVDARDRNLDRVLEIVKDSVLGKVGATGEA